MIVQATIQNIDKPRTAASPHMYVAGCVVCAARYVFVGACVRAYEGGSEFSRFAVCDYQFAAASKVGKELRLLRSVPEFGYGVAAKMLSVMHRMRKI
jgi:hypothetical protein